MSDRQIVCRASRAIAASLVLAGLAACSSFNTASTGVANSITPYKIEIVQGNFVSKEQREALQVGMPRAQVRDILGSPMVTSVFHADRWDYVFSLRRQGQEPQQRKVSVYFKGDELTKITADELPSEEEFVGTLSKGRTVGKPAPMEVPESALVEFGLKNAASAKSAQAASAAPTAPSTRNYPPLEKP